MNVFSTILIPCALLYFASSSLFACLYAHAFTHSLTCPLAVHFLFAFIFGKCISFAHCVLYPSVCTVVMHTCNINLGRSTGDDDDETDVCRLSDDMVWQEQRRRQLWLRQQQQESHQWKDQKCKLTHFILTKTDCRSNHVTRRTQTSAHTHAHCKYPLLGLAYSFAILCTVAHNK